MTTPIVLTGGETVFGTAIDNTGTDNFIVGGASNTIVEGGGNLIVNGENVPGAGYDTATTIVLGNAYAVDDQLLLDGANNVFEAATPGDTLVDSTLNIAVTGDGLSKAAQGQNVINLINSDGTTKIKLTGTHNDVTLNSDATNTITTGGAYATVSVGVGDDYSFGYSTTIKLAGKGNTVTAGDQNNTITGGKSNNTISVGDGNNTITLKGTHNAITAWGGTENIVAGSGNDTVTILGSHGTDSPVFIYDPSIPIAEPPTDTVTLAGSGDAVTATYENMMINGTKVTGDATLNFGIGNNAITLGGNANTVDVGDGTNNAAFTGNNNGFTVTDPAGLGTDNVTVGNGTGDVISFDHAGGSVAGSSLGLNTVEQATNALRNVTVALNNGIGIVSLGNGNDSITANGAGSSIIAGYGNDTVNANGAGAVVTLGSGDDVVQANGLSAFVTVGDGNDMIFANGTSATVMAGNGSDEIQANGFGAIVTAGNGNDSIQANGGNAMITAGYGNDDISFTGANSTATVSAIATSQDTLTMGSSDTLNITSGVDQVTGVAGDTIVANQVQLNSVFQLSGNNNMAFIGSDSSMNLLLNQAQTGEQITIQADNGNTYGGVVDISYFNQSDVMTLNGLVGGITGTDLNSYASVLANITAGPNADTLHLAGGGSIVFAAVTGFTSNEFLFGTHTGPVT